MSRRWGFPTGVVQTNPDDCEISMFLNAGMQHIELHADFSDPAAAIAGFQSASFHVSKKSADYVQEAEDFIAMGVAHVVVHPNWIDDPQRWRALGSHVLVENLDFRHSNWRDADDLARLLDVLPDAGVCLDLAHAMDAPWAIEGIIERYGAVIREIHFSEIDAATAHHLPSLSAEAIAHCKAYLSVLPETIPAVMEVHRTPMAQAIAQIDVFRR